MRKKRAAAAAKSAGVDGLLVTQSSGCALISVDIRGRMPLWCWWVGGAVLFTDGTVYGAG